MTTSGIHWVRPPSALNPAIAEFGRRVLVAVHAVAAYVGQQMQNHARQTARWTDRTGNARSGLFFAVDGFGLPPIFGQISGGAATEKSDTVQISGGPDQLVIVLGHTVFYGKWLELANGGAYAVIMSTIEAHLGELEKQLKDVLR